MISKSRAFLIGGILIILTASAFIVHSFSAGDPSVLLKLSDGSEVRFRQVTVGPMHSFRPLTTGQKILLKMFGTNGVNIGPLKWKPPAAIQVPVNVPLALWF